MHIILHTNFVSFNTGGRSVAGILLDADLHFVCTDAVFLKTSFRRRSY